MEYTIPANAYHKSSSSCHKKRYPQNKICIGCVFWRNVDEDWKNMEQLFVTCKQNINRWVEWGSGHIRIFD